MEHIEFEKTRDFGMIFNDSFAFVRQNFKALALCLIFIPLPILLISGFLIAESMANIMKPFMSMVSQGAEYKPQSEDIAKLFSGFLSPSFLSAIVASVIGSMLLYGTTTIFVRNYVRGQSLEVSEVWQGIVSNFGTLASTSLGGGLLMGLFISLTAIMNMLPCLGTIGWIILILFLAVLMQLLYPIRFEENWGLFDAITRGRELLKGHWWQSVGLFLVMYIIVAIMASIFSAPAQIYMQMVMPSAMKNGVMDPTQLVGTFKVFFYIAMLLGQFSALLYSLILITFYFQYFSLVEEKEGQGLSGRIEGIR
jgi:hypothetical protein